MCKLSGYGMVKFCARMEHRLILIWCDQNQINSKTLTNCLWARVSFSGAVLEALPFPLFCHSLFIHSEFAGTLTSFHSKDSVWRGSKRVDSLQIWPCLARGRRIWICGVSPYNGVGYSVPISASVQRTLLEILWWNSSDARRSVVNSYMPYHVTWLCLILWVAPLTWLMASFFPRVSVACLHLQGNGRIWGPSAPWLSFGVVARFTWSSLRPMICQDLWASTLRNMKREDQWDELRNDRSRFVFYMH